MSTTEEPNRSEVEATRDSKIENRRAAIEAGKVPLLTQFISVFDEARTAMRERQHAG